MAKPGYKKVVQAAPQAATRTLYRIEADGNVLELIGERTYKYLVSNTKQGETLTLKEDQRLPKGEFISEQEVEKLMVIK